MKTTLEIRGMSCGHCVASVRKTLAGLDGVAVEHVAVGSAAVEYAPAVASPEQIADAVSKTGYTAAAVS